jgi:hypothetical protein
VHDKPLTIGIQQIHDKNIGCSTASQPLAAANSMQSRSTQATSQYKNTVILIQVHRHFDRDRDSSFFFIIQIEIKHPAAL